MFGKTFTMDHLVKTIVMYKPSSVTIGTHHYVQMAESNFLQGIKPEKLKSVKLLLPVGAAVPFSCEEILMKKFIGLKVNIILQNHNNYTE